MRGASDSHYQGQRISHVQRCPEAGFSDDRAVVCPQVLNDFSQEPPI
jgi:hypothetical protein